MAEAGSPLIYGCYLIIVQDAGRTYSMVCSWATQVSDRYAILCIGGQSETGKVLREGTEFSLNVLLREQLDLARLAGTKHSRAVDKLAGVALETRSGVTWLARAKKRMRCRVERFLDVAAGDATRGVLVEILAPVEEQGGEPLLLDEVLRGA
ncbi:MAG: flavin reductase [Candidatus Bipolaricaulota bacterium]|nr:flavin reductase [Candidatus Bipolaricaulota bacterium]